MALGGTIECGRRINPVSRRFAMDETGSQPTSLAELARASRGRASMGRAARRCRPFRLQLRRAGSIEEHIHLSVLFKEFFAGELSLLCTLAISGGKLAFCIAVVTISRLSAHGTHW